MSAKLTDAHLHKLSLAFYAGLKSGDISVEVASIFADRVFDAWLEHAVKANPAMRKEAYYDQAYKVITEEGN